MCFSSFILSFLFPTKIDFYLVLWSSFFITQRSSFFLCPVFFFQVNRSILFIRFHIFLLCSRCKNRPIFISRISHILFLHRIHSSTFQIPAKQILFRGLSWWTFEIVPRINDRSQFFRWFHAVPPFPKLVVPSNFQFVTKLRIAFVCK